MRKLFATEVLGSLLWLSVVCASGPFRSQFPNKDRHAEQSGNGKLFDDPGKPLFLTPYIEKGDVETGRKLATVGPLEGTSLTSYSGFLTVNKTINSNMFFWFFPSQNDPKKDPILLWLQGGPGGSSLFGLFNENGPIGVDKNIKLFRREVNWNSKYSMLYIDNPVGTGFSFTDSDKGYATNEDDVAENLYNALTQFFTLFNELKGVDFYITGESYAGKYIPAIAHRIHKEGVPRKIYLRGVAIGDGWSDPQVMVGAYADFMFQTGQLDENQRDHFQTVAIKCQQMIKNKQFADAFQILNQGYAAYQNASGQEDMYNYLRTKPPVDFEYYNDFLSMPAVRKAIHVGNLSYNSGEKVEKFLINDILDTVKPLLADIMNYYKVLIYSGQLDVIVALPLTEAMLQTVPWQYLDEYKRAERHVWKVHPSDAEVAGYVRRVHDFYQVMVRGGGHILPFDQPERSLDMIDRFITGRPFF